MDTATTVLHPYGHTLSQHDALPIWKHFLLFLLAPLLALAPLSETGANTTSFHSDTSFTSRIKKKLKIDTVQLLRSDCRQCGLGYAMQPEIGRASCRERVGQYV